MPIAIVREVAASFAAALAATAPDPPIDVARARRQHAAYVAALAELGVEPLLLPADDTCPDCCFVEDTCVIAGDLAVITRPGAPSRRAEVEPIAQLVAKHRRVVRMEAPATLDGGDCLRLGRTLYVGRSERTNAAGIEALRTAVAPAGFAVVAVDMPAGVLHLKTVCSPLADDLVLVAADTLPPSTFGNARILTTPRTEPHAANVLALGAAALVPADAPRTQSLLESAGFRAIPIDTSEMRKADGALTCLSILL